MQTTHTRHSKHIYRKKIILFAALWLCSAGSFAQNLNKPFYDYSRRIHFGFTIGTNFSHFKYEFSPVWYNPPTPGQDTFLAVRTKSYPGFTVGPVINLHVGSTRSRLREHFDIRAVPVLALTQRDLIYTLKDSTEVTKQVESALVELPILLKFKSDRFGNFRFYTLGGFKYGFDLSSEANATPNISNPRVAVYPHNISYELGTGLDLYFPYFKFSPEVKISRGINNVLVPSSPPGANKFTDIFSRFRSEFIFFSLYFEG
jgi:hypothetical protein